MAIKVKDLPIQAAPALTDYAVTNKAAGTATEKTLWSSIKTMFGNLVTGFGTTGYLTKYTNGATGAIGNSLISESGTIDTVNGELKVYTQTLGNKVLTITSFSPSATNPIEEKTQQEVTTNNATTTTLQTIPIDAAYIHFIEATITAVKSNMADVGAYVIRGAYKNIGGTVTLIGAVQSDFTAESNAAWDATFDISTTNVRIRVTGVAGTLIMWQTTTRMTKTNFPLF